MDQRHEGSPGLTLGDYIRRARLNAGLQQDEVARKVGVSKQLVSRWERNQSMPGIHHALRLADATGAEYLADLRKLPITCTRLAAGHRPYSRSE